MFSCEFCETSKNTDSTEHLRTTASGFCDIFRGYRMRPVAWNELSDQRWIGSCHNELTKLNACFKKLTTMESFLVKIVSCTFAILLTSFSNNFSPKTFDKYFRVASFRTSLDKCFCWKKNLVKTGKDSLPEKCPFGVFLVRISPYLV